MTPEERIDAALNSVLKASGSSLRHYSKYPAILDAMREAMREIMAESYNAGVDDYFASMKSAKDRRP